MPESPPFVFQAAKASWVAPLVASALGFGAKIALQGNTQLDPQTLRVAWLVIGGLAVLIVTAGLVLGIAALFGVKKHGWRGILIPSVIGILLCSGYLYLLASTVLLVRRLAAEQGVG